MIAMCDQKDCKEPASLAYRWDWGATGKCCQLHAQLLQQTAQNLSRGISLAPLAEAAEAPLERSERTQLIAAKLSAEAEADEIKARGAELYRANVDLTKQVQTLTLKNREANAQIERLEDQVAKLQSQLAESQADRATLTDENVRLTTLAAFTPEETQPSVQPPA